MPDAASPIQRPRAGFWRRFAALVIDFVVVTVPIQLVVVVLFATTHGAVQTTDGIAFKGCRDVPLAQLPEHLVPAPPGDVTSARICSTSLFGLETARNLIVSRTADGSYRALTFQKAYSLDAFNHPNDPISLDGFGFLAVAAYLVLMERRFGATLGKRVLGLRVAQTLGSAGPDQAGLPLRGAITRYVTMYAAWLPLLIVVLIDELRFRGDVEHTIAGATLFAAMAAGLIAILWLLWIVIDVVRKRDPIHDRLAGTAVVRVLPATMPGDVCGQISLPSRWSTE